MSDKLDDALDELEARELAKTANEAPREARLIMKAEEAAELLTMLDDDDQQRVNLGSEYAARVRAYVRYINGENGKQDD